MTTLIETRGAAFFMVSEANGHRSREQGTLLDGQDLQSGTILGRITASGKLVQHDPDAENGSEVVAGILYAKTNADGADEQVAYIARDAEVLGAELVYAEDADEEVIDAELAAVLNIIVR